MRNTSSNRALALVIASGAAASFAAVAHAQPHLVNVSGATLMENVIKSPASTNDFIDADGDGDCGPCNGAVDQLAPFGLPPGSVAGQHWIVQYRVVGSVNGFQELVDFGQTFVSTADNVEIFSTDADKAFHSRTQYIASGAASNAIFNAANPGGAPVRSLNDGSYLATTSTDPLTTGIQIDVAPLDVPARWAVQQPGTPGPEANPGAAGYGTNPRTTTNKDGSPNGFDHLLADLGGLNLYDPADPDAADGNTIFDTPIAFAPIAAITNLGTGLRQIDMSDLRYMSATGRMRTGENLIQITRDSGSGTRNGYQNSIGVEPSWGVGENIGGLSTAAELNLVGPDYQPSGKGGSGGLETTLFNTRLGIAYTGAERGVNSGWLTGGRAEVLAVRNDVTGGVEYSRPNIDEILDNDADGYVIGGPGTLCTIGDPLSAPTNLGGDAGNTNPEMRNPHAAAYVNNMTRSIAAFKSVPGGDESLFMPGEMIALRLTLTTALDYVQDPADPLVLVPNPNLNQALQDFTRDFSELSAGAYYTFGTAGLNGKAPTRKTGVTYSDGLAGGGSYITQGGAAVSYGSNLSDRNRIGGDFNGDGLRDLNDAAEMLKAYQARNSGPAWVAPAGTGAIAGAPGTDAIIEVLGDFNCDGDFDAADVRYWADGLAIDPATGNLDREAGFEAIDDAWFALTGSNNFFGTTIAGGHAYTTGDSRFDVANAAGDVARGWAPVGADGVVDALDREAIAAQFLGNPFILDGHADWSDLSEAVYFDLSCDATGDLVVDLADLNAIDALLGAGCYADCTGDGTLSVADFACFRDAYLAGDTAAADCTGEGSLSVADFTCFRNAYLAGCP